MGRFGLPVLETGPVWKPRWHNYRSTCGNTSHDQYVANGTRESYSTVESYRGKPVYLQVGTKRRMAFHPFYRHRYTLSGTATYSWCDPINGSKKAWFEDWSATVLMNLNRTCVNSTTGNWSRTDICRGDIAMCMAPPHEALGSELREFVVRDLYVKANSPRFDGAVFLAELDETLVGIHKLLGGAAKSLFRSGEFIRNSKSILGNPEGLWLWFRYALLPAMMDVESIVEAMKPPRQPDRIQDGDRSDDWIKETGTTEYKWTTGWPNPWFPVNWENKYRYGLGGAMDIRLLYDPAPFGTSAVDVLRAAVERVPFSFIADWFINLQDWLTSLRDVNLDVAQSYATYAIENELEIKSGDHVNLLTGKNIVNSFTMMRIVDVEPPRLPLIDKRWRNTVRTIDLLALTIGALRRALKKRR